MNTDIIKGNWHVTKFLIIGCAILLGTTPTFAKTLSPQEAKAAFAGLIPCDGSKKAEEACKMHCTGDHPLLLTEGNCKDQKTWTYCLTHCRKDWIDDCAKTATKRNLSGLPQCQ